MHLRFIWEGHQESFLGLMLKIQSFSLQTFLLVLNTSKSQT